MQPYRRLNSEHNKTAVLTHIIHIGLTEQCVWPVSIQDVWNIVSDTPWVPHIWRTVSWIWTKSELNLNWIWTKEAIQCNSQYIAEVSNLFPPRATQQKRGQITIYQYFYLLIISIIDSFYSFYHLTYFLCSAITYLKMWGEKCFLSW